MIRRSSIGFLFFFLFFLFLFFNFFLKIFFAITFFSLILVGGRGGGCLGGRRVGRASMARSFPTSASGSSLNWLTHSLVFP